MHYTNWYHWKQYRKVWGAYEHCRLEFDTQTLNPEDSNNIFIDKVLKIYDE